MSAVNDGRCSPWVMCSCSVMSGNQICDTHILHFSVLRSRLDSTIMQGTVQEGC